MKQRIKQNCCPSFRIQVCFFCFLPDEEKDDEEDDETVQTKNKTWAPRDEFIFLKPCLLSDISCYLLFVYCFYLLVQKKLDI